ncbi:hypothetical protein RJ55_00414 [Drechmeria coniospora]|nr:hypothetical protein RJ55_00414 [Drechmeria coniospora]
MASSAPTHHLQAAVAVFAPVRPTFNSRRTSDRLREGAGLYLPPQFRTNAHLSKGHTSVFKEVGLDEVASSRETSLDEDCRA